MKTAWTIRFLTFVTLLLAHACYDDEPTSPSTTRDADSIDAVSALWKELGEDPHMVALAAEIPGFAGFHYEAGGDRIVVSMAGTDTAGFSVARKAVYGTLALAAGGSPQLAKHSSHAAVVERAVTFSFLELARQRARLRSRIFEIPGVVALSVDEEFNRIKIGLENPSAREAVHDLAIELAVPIEMLSFSEVRASEPTAMRNYAPMRPQQDSGTLRGPVPEGKLQGGYQIQSRWSGECTLSFTALRGPWTNPEKLFVTVSHCSVVPLSLDEGAFKQPSMSANYPWVGNEVEDPDPFECGRGSTRWRRSARDSIRVQVNRSYTRCPTPPPPPPDEDMDTLR